MEQKTLRAFRALSSLVLGSLERFWLQEVWPGNTWVGGGHSDVAHPGVLQAEYGSGYRDTDYIPAILAVISS